MNKTQNPYNVLGFFDRPVEGKPLLSPTKKLIPFQVNMLASDGTSMKWYLVNKTTGVKVEMNNGLLNMPCYEDKVSISYNGSALAIVVEEGLYQIELEFATKRLYSYPFRACCGFDELDFSVSVSNCVASPFSMTFELVGSWATNGIEVNFGSGWIDATTIDESTPDLPSTLSKVPFRSWVTYCGHKYYNYYTLKFNPTSPTVCDDYTLSFNYSENTRVYDNAFIEFWNSNDLTDIIYQAGFKQRFYFKPNHDHPNPIKEEKFFKNGEGSQFLEDVSMSEKTNIEMFPIPDYLTSVLTFIRYHDNKNIHLFDGTQVDSMVNFEFTPTVASVNIDAKGRMSYERNSIYVGCPENYAIGACP